LRLVERISDVFVPLSQTLLANQTLTLNPSPDRRFAARRERDFKSGFPPSPSVSVREKGPGDEG
jgi:hypothetical protein